MISHPSLPACCTGNAVVNVYINKEKNFAFVEFRTGASDGLIVLSKMFDSPIWCSCLVASGQTCWDEE